MMKKYILLITICWVSLMANAQRIDFVLAKDANKAYSFAVYNGLKMDTIAKGTISAMGMGTIHIPPKYKDTPAMGTLEIAGRNGIMLILEDENFSFEEKEEGKPLFNGSIENDLLYNKPNEAMNEPNKPTYAQAYAKMMNAMVRISRVVSNPNSMNLFEKSSARLAALNDVDVDKLYYSRFWYFMIDGLMKMSTGEEGFGNDLIRLLDKTKTDKVYVAFAEDIITITNQFGMDDTFDLVIPHIEQSRRIEYPQGSIYDAFAMAKVRKGLEAPAVDGLAKKAGSDYTLLIFYQPGCENCEEQLEELKKSYAFFGEHRVRVVTISAAMDEKEFKEEVKSFLWEDKLCDLKGFAGVNFQRFGIIGTPTMYLVDKENMVSGRFSKIMSIEEYIKRALHDAL